MAACLALPFVAFWWLCPFASRRTMAMDYQDFAPIHQAELQFALRTGTVPLYVPGFAGGQTVSALTQGQLFHPLPYVAAALPGYWRGWSLEWTTLLKLLELGATHLLLHRFLRRLELRPVPAWLVAASAVYNLRMLDSFRYNVSLESYCALLALCAFVGFHFLEPDRRGPRAWIAVCTYLLIASGHPQWSFLGVLSAVVYTLALPAALSAIRPGWRSGKPGRAIVVALGSMALGGLLTAAYAVPFYFDFMRNNAARMRASFAWATDLSPPARGLLASFYDPLHADVHGSFAGTALLLLAAVLPALLLFRVRVPAVMLALWGFCLAVLVVAAGRNTAVYGLLYEHAPLWSSFRIPGRCTLMLVPPLLLLLAWAVAEVPDGLRLWRRRVALLGALALAALLVARALASAAPMPDPKYAPSQIRALPSSADVVLLALAITSLLALIAASLWPRHRAPLEAALLLAVVAHATALMTWGTWEGRKTPQRTFGVMAKQRRDPGWILSWSPTVNLLSGGMGSAPVERALEVADRDARLAWIAHRCLPARSEAEANAYVRDRRWPEELVVEGAGASCACAGRTASGSDRVSLAYTSFNRMTLDVESAGRGCMAVNVPYTTAARTYWSATVNGASVPLHRANGLLHMVAVPPGASRVDLRYWSRPAFVGLLLSAAAAAGALMYLAAGLGRRRWITAARIAAPLAMSGLVYAWYTHLYDGRDWATRYEWRSPE